MGIKKTIFWMKLNYIIGLTVIWAILLRRTVLDCENNKASSIWLRGWHCWWCSSCSCHAKQINRLTDNNETKKPPQKKQKQKTILDGWGVLWQRNGFRKANNYAISFCNGAICLTKIKIKISKQSDKCLRLLPADTKSTTILYLSKSTLHNLYKLIQINCNPVKKCNS